MRDEKQRQEGGQGLVMTRMERKRSTIPRARDRRVLGVCLGEPAQQRRLDISIYEGDDTTRTQNLEEQEGRTTMRCFIARY